MDIAQLKEAAVHGGEMEIHVIRSEANKLYQIECRSAQGYPLSLEQRGRPQLFRSLEAVYDVLKAVGIQHAYLVKWEQRHGVELVDQLPVDRRGLISVAL